MSKTQTNDLTITFAVGADVFLGTITSYSLDGETADDVDTSTLATSTTRTFQPGKIIDGGTVTFELQVDPELARLATGVADTATITYPLSNSGNTNEATRVFACYINSYSETGTINELMTSTLVLKVAGTPVFTPES